MSHFSVLVLHAKDNSFEDLLAPFDENLEVKPYLYVPHEKLLQKWNRLLLHLILKFKKSTKQYPRQID